MDRTFWSSACRGLSEEPELESEPAWDATIPTTITTLESGSGTEESERREETTANPNLLYTVSLARTSYAVAVHRDHAAPSHTCSRAHTDEADHADPCPAQETQGNAAASELRRNASGH